LPSKMFWTDVVRQSIVGIVAATVVGIIGLVFVINKNDYRVTQTETRLDRLEISNTVILAKLSTLETKFAYDIGDMKADIQFIRGVMEAQQQRHVMADFHWLPDVAMP
jgi:hypothetical protein